MSRIGSLATWIGVLALAVGCGDDGAAWQAPVELSDGVTVVYAAPGSNRTFETTIVDVERIGSTLVMLVIHREVVAFDEFGGYVVLPTPQYFVSEDSGSTWRESAVTDVSDGDRYPHLAGPNGGLFAFGGELYELVPWYVSRALEDHPTMRLYHLDLDAGRRRFVAELEASYWLLGERGLMGPFGDTWTTWDPVTGQPVDTQPIPASPGGSGPSCSSPRYDEGPWGDGAREVRQTCVISYPGEPEQWCETFIEPPLNFTARASCVAEPDWPVPAEGLGYVHASEGLVVTTYSGEQAQTSLARFGAGGVELLPVGPGRPQTRYATDTAETTAGRRRFAGMVPLVTYASDLGVESSEPQTTLYRLRGAGGFEAAPIPTRPCPDGRPCGYRPYTVDGARQDSALQWVQHVGAVDVLAFYVIDAALPSEGMSQNKIVVSRHRVETPAADATRYHNDLTDACGFATSCFDPEQRFTFDGCLAAGSRVRRSAYDALLSAVDCDDVRAAFPDFAFEPCAEVSAACVGDTLRGCDGQRVYEIDCADLGSTCGDVEGAPGCLPDPCPIYTCLDDGRMDHCGTVVACPEGEACANVAAADGTFYGVCAAVEPACEAAGSVCVGDVAVWCVAPGFGRPANDCARLPNGACAAGTCGAIEPVAVCDPPWCEGDVLVFCAQSVIEVDCGAMGLGCEVVAETGDGRCE